MSVDILQEYKELYYQEIEHSERLNAKIGTSLTLLTVLISGEVILWIDMFPIQTNFFHLSYLTLCSFSMAPLIFSTKFFLKSYAGYDYQYFPIEKIKSNIEKSITHANTLEDGQNKLDKHISFIFEQKYSEDAIHNRKQNQLKSENQRRLTVWIMASFLIVVPSLALWIGYINPQNKAQKPIQVIMRGGEVMCNNNNPDGFPPIPPSDVFHESFTTHEINTPTPPTPQTPETSKPE